MTSRPKPFRRVKYVVRYPDGGESWHDRLEDARAIVEITGRMSLRKGRIFRATFIPTPRGRHGKKK